LFKQFSRTVNCVVLNACYSKTQAKAIAEHIAYVVGMNRDIGDGAAIAFAIGFYQAIGGGRSVEDAYHLGCVQIALQGIPEELTPVLIKKSPSSERSAGRKVGVKKRSPRKYGTKTPAATKSKRQDSQGFEDGCQKDRIGEKSNEGATASA
jgi:hypothetical protein